MFVVFEKIFKAPLKLGDKYVLVSVVGQHLSVAKLMQVNYSCSMLTYTDTKIQLAVVFGGEGCALIQTAASLPASILTLSCGSGIGQISQVYSEYSFLTFSRSALVCEVKQEKDKLRTSRW